MRIAWCGRRETGLLVGILRRQGSVNQGDLECYGQQGFCQQGMLSLPVMSV